MFKNDTIAADGKHDFADHRLAGIFEVRGTFHGLKEMLTNSYKMTMR